MNDHSRYRNMSDEDLEDLIRGLAHRRPSAALRDRVLGLADRRVPGRFALPRPAFALAALFVLLLAALLILTSQNAGLAMKRAPAAFVRAEASPAEGEYLAWPEGIGRPGLTQRMALLRAHEHKRQHTYSLLRRSLLDNAEGG